jgi:hypothetical protein
MTQVHGSQAGPADAVREYDDVRRVVQLFLDGEAKGDAAKLREASHPDARVFGSVGGTRYDMPIAEFIELATKEPGDTGNHRRALRPRGHVPAGVGEQLAYHLPGPLDARELEVVDEGERPPVALLGHLGHSCVSRVLHREEGLPHPYRL